MASARKPSARKRWIVAVILVALIGASYGGWRYVHQAWASGHRAAPAPQVVPVTAAQVSTGDFPVYVMGLGTVQPYETVTVHSRVDGQITQVLFKQGQMVHAGDLLAQIDPRPYQAALDQAKAKKGEDEAQLQNAKLDLARYQQLAKNDFASRQQLNTQQATVAQLTAQIAADQAAIDSAGTELDYSSIKSPITGMTGFRQIDPGNIVHAADTTGIVTIVRLQPISVVFTAPEDQVQAIAQALQKGEVPVTALSSDASRTLSQGHLALVNNTIDEASGTIGMKATFENTDHALWPGLSVSTRLLLETQKNVTLVPQDAVQRGPNGLYVFVIGKDNKVEQRPIKIGAQGEDKAVIEDGLKSGETVVTEGQYRLQQGTLVTENKGTQPATSDGSSGDKAQ